MKIDYRLYRRCILGAFFLNFIVLNSAFAIDEKNEQEPLTMFVHLMRTEQEISKAPASVALISEKEIAREAEDNLAEMLRDVPGVEITDSGQAGLKRIRIRGEESRRVAILIDGQIFADERDVGTPLLIAPEMIERIEIIRGTGSVLYGSRAIGGVINFITKKGGSNPIQLGASSSYDTATNGYNLFSSVYGQKYDIGYRLSGTTSEHQDRQAASGKIDNTSYDNKSFSIYLDKNIDDHTFAISYDKFEGSSEVYVAPEVRFKPPFLDFAIDAPKRDRSKAAFFYDWLPAKEIIEKIHLDAYYQESDRQFDTFSTVGVELPMGEIMKNSGVYNYSNLDTVGLNAQADFKINKEHYLITGVLLKNDDLNQNRRLEQSLNNVSKGSETIYDSASQETSEIFAQEQWTFLEDFSLVTGVRGYSLRSKLKSTTRENLEPFSKSDSNAIGSIGLRYLGFKDTTLWTTLSQGYIAPTLINLGTGAYAGPDFINPNPNLDSESSKSIDSGFRYYKGAFELDTTLFYAEGRDYIGYRACSVSEVACLESLNGSRDRVYENIDKATTFGAEASVGYYMSEEIKPYTNVAWIRRRFEEDSVSSYDTGLPTFTNRLGVLYEREFGSKLDGWLDLYLRTNTSSYDNFQEYDKENGGWGTININLGLAHGEKKDLRFNLELLNLGDKEYINSTENIPARGRSAIFKISTDI